ncbi:MAG TPA: hypothetical protein DCX32_00640 [Candidatus Moranbacteria bacterium]|nr:MAG: hypothetical protein UW87_C0006G0025 [Candidatus Moranbacteria bacterium GW2011_GWC2_45_10]KKT95549.1 MAG: hypothetical protein UW95_C0001G0113 [Parcubacteria group bacterium GW2011_GWC1_45_14]HAV11044.1 hypothetical protein [Candidatus Moranbacteria bacterium]
MGDLLAKFTQSGIVAELSAIGAVLLVISVMFWLVIGRFRLHNALINIYISFAILQVAYEEILAFGKFMPISVFLILVVFLTLVDSNLFEIHLSGSGLAIWQVIVLSFLEAGLLVSIVSSLVPEKQILKYISIDSFEYFVSPLASILWMVAPLAFLILIGRRGK